MNKELSNVQDEQGNELTTISRSGGVEVSSENSINVGNDVVGRDKITNTTVTIGELNLLFVKQSDDYLWWNEAEECTNNFEKEWLHKAYSSEANWNCNVSQLAYINIPRLATLAALGGYEFNDQRFYEISDLHSLGGELNYLVAQIVKVLRELQIHATHLCSLAFTDSEIGMTVTFEERFRTKNGLKINDLPKKFLLTGDLECDPQIYVHQADFKIILPINPRWITTDTAFYEFRPPSGQSYFAGLFILKNIDFERKVALGTPIVIGTPRSHSEPFFGS